jgi:hypothetical protein
VVRFTPQPMRAVGEPTLPVLDTSASANEPTLVLARAPKSASSASAGSGTERASREMQAAPPSSGREQLRSPTPVSAIAPAVVDPKRPGIFAFAGFGLAPENLGAAPTYAFRVLARRRVLRRDLALARARRSPDVELYEAALRTADEKVVRRGLLLVAFIVLTALGAFGGAIELLF